MRKTTTVTAPDGGVTTIKSKSSCGCLTFLVIVIAAGLLIDSWQGSSTLERVLYVCLPIAIAAFALFAYSRRQEPVPDGPLSRHLAQCPTCEQDLPCDEWDRLYEESEASSAAASPASGASRGVVPSEPVQPQ